MRRLSSILDDDTRVQQKTDFKASVEIAKKLKNITNHSNVEHKYDMFGRELFLGDLVIFAIRSELMLFVIKDLSDGKVGTATSPSLIDLYDPYMGASIGNVRSNCVIKINPSNYLK